MKRQLWLGIVTERSSKKYLPLLVFVICAFIGVMFVVSYLSTIRNSQESIAGQNELRFSNTELNAGSVFEGDVHAFSFRFRNFTQNDVQMARPFAACACTDVGVVPKQISPGKTGVVSGKIRFPNRQGQMTERILVRSSDGGQHVLKIHANIVGRYKVSPLKLDFGDVWWDQLLEGAIYITSEGLEEAPGSLEVAPGHHHCVNATITRCQKHKWRVDIRVQYPKVGGFHQCVCVRTKPPRQIEIFIPILANVQGPLTITPDRLFLGSVTANQQVKRDLILAKRPGTHTKIEKISASQVPVAIKRYTSQQEDITNLEIELQFSEATGLIEDNLVIETSSPQWIVYVPIIAFVSKKSDI